MGATELIQGLGRALADLREAGHPQHVLQQLEDDITALDAMVVKDAAEAEQWAAKLVARLYGIVHPAPAALAAEQAPGPVPEPADTPEPASTPPESSPGSSAPADGPAMVTTAAIPAADQDSLDAQIAALQAQRDAQASNQAPYSAQ